MMQPINRKPTEFAGCVWLVLRATSSPFQKELVNHLKTWTDQHSGAELRVLRAERRRLTQDGLGRRPIDVVHPIDAHKLYQDVHLMRTCVLGQGGIFVLRDPRKDPPTQRDCISLREFVCHKAAFEIVEDGREPGEQAERLLAKPSTDCLGIKDPRVIPLHVFRGGLQPSELLDVEGRSRFRRAFQNKGGGWASPNAGVWSPADARARHGAAGTDRSALKVGDLELPLGFHWDVSGPRPIAIMNSSTVWKLDRSGYVNIYPDAFIRQGSKGARMAWEAKR